MKFITGVHFSVNYSLPWFHMGEGEHWNFICPEFHETLVGALTCALYPLHPSLHLPSLPPDPPRKKSCMIVIPSPFFAFLLAFTFFLSVPTSYCFLFSFSLHSLLLPRSCLSPTFPSDECTQFLIDIGVELIILYEHIYEIYGDIQGARNSFDINAYEQG